MDPIAAAPDRTSPEVNSDAVLLAAHRHLAARHRPLLAAWRRSFHPAIVLRAGLGEPECAERATAVIEQLLLPRPELARGGAGGGGDEGALEAAAVLAAIREQIHYSAARLVKLGVPLPVVNAALARFQPLAVAQLTAAWDERTAAAVQNRWQQQTSAAVAEAYVASSNNALHALLAVLDAELDAGGLPELLQRLLRQAAQLFPIRWGEILLTGADGRLRHAAAYGFDPACAGDAVEGTGLGAFFHQVARRGEPGFLLDAGRDGRLGEASPPMPGVKSLWAVPLARGARPGLNRPVPEVLGVLAVAFARRYECLPQERELLLALAERSTLAIERTRISERLSEQQKRVLELSRRLLDAQDEERRRISRDLHDETGQALLALRLYLEMGLREGSRAGVDKWLRQGVELVDSSVAELRRILAQLSPLLLDELGLEAALRLELRRLRQQQQWRARFEFGLGGARLDRAVEILVYRVVLEGLRNIARHARARHVHLKITAAAGRLDIRLRDDGVGMPHDGRGQDGRGRSPARAAEPAHFGLSGMRERVRLAGGRLEVESARGRGVRLSIQIPIASPGMLKATGTGGACAPPAASMNRTTTGGDKRRLRPIAAAARHVS